MTAGLLITGTLIGLGATPAPAADAVVLHKSVQDVTHPGTARAA